MKLRVQKCCSFGSLGPMCNFLIRPRTEEEHRILYFLMRILYLSYLGSQCETGGQCFDVEPI